MYWELAVIDNFFSIKYSLYVVNVSFKNIVDSFKNAGGAKAAVAKISFQEELFNLEQSGKALPNRIRLFKSPPTTRCQYISKEIKTYDSENPKTKSDCVDYGLLTHISEIKNILGIDTSIVPKIVGFSMQKHDDWHKLWSQALSIYVFFPKWHFI
jgi:hypothetical protein